VLFVVLTAAIAALRSRARTAGYGWLGIALLVGCGGPATNTADAGTVDPADATMEPEASPPSCELTQVPLAQPAVASTTLVTARSIFIGDARGLWRSSGIDERFERVTSMPGDSRDVVTLVGLDDGAIFAVIGEGRVLMSRDDGERWEELVELPPVSGVTAPRLHTDGERVVGTVAPGGGGVQALYDLDHATGDWIEIVADEPVEGWGHGFVLVGVDEGALLATPSGYRSGGLFRLERGAARWEHVEGLNENGYTTFARHGDVAVIASGTGIWAEIDGLYRRVLEHELGAPIIVSTADGFLGVAAEGVLRSSDGIAWDVDVYADGALRSPKLLSESGGRVATLRDGDASSFVPRLVSLSDDLGASWREPSIVSQSFERVSTHGEDEHRISYVSPYAWWPYEGFVTWQGGAWSSFSWRLPYGASAVAMTETGAWGCAFTGCVHRSDDGELGPQIAMPESPFAHEPTTAFATSHGLFVSPRSYGTSCGVVQPGLVVLRDGAEWEDASAGLRSWEPECAGTPSVATVSAMLEERGVLWATQSRQYAIEPFEPVVLRSIDGGRSWREVREGAEFVALVRTEAGAYGLFRPGVIEALDASGEVFAEVAAQPGGGEVVDMVALDGRLVAATAEAGGGLWLSDDGARSWEPLLSEARIGPIADLDVHGSVLSIASRTSGLWEASECFER
jgi:hypothetical protein